MTFIYSLLEGQGHRVFLFVHIQLVLWGTPYDNIDVDKSTLSSKYYHRFRIFKVFDQENLYVTIWRCPKLP